MGQTSICLERDRSGRPSYLLGHLYLFKISNIVYPLGRHVSPVISSFSSGLTFNDYPSSLYYNVFLLSALE